MVQPGCTGSATLSEKTSRWGTSAKLVSPCTVSGRTVSGTRRPFASARPMVALPTHTGPSE